MGRVDRHAAGTGKTPMSSQVTVHSVDAPKDFRVRTVALYGEDTLVGSRVRSYAEVRRTVRWLEQERPAYWQEQINRRREQVSQAKAEVFADSSRSGRTTLRP